jgi:DNA polymerase-3 subunit gamma/tau
MSSYKVLARKWRPQKFADMIGQDHVLRALVNALDNQRLHHAYLFTGMRGVGKTTIARIFAKCLNCETNGVSSNPCGECSTCKDIDAGRFFDLIEVDAASRTKVDETRELLENVPYAPTSGRFKVYLIDEVHMFSTHSFNALLKTLEEPPEHVKFLLATTDPQKVPVTVLSRCLQFNLKRMASSRLSDYLGEILTSEGMGHDKSALELIARAAEGSVRDSLSLVEQAAAFGGGEVRESDVESMLGRVSTERLISLLGTIANGDTPAIFEQVSSMAEYAPDYEQVLGELLSLLHRVAMLQSLPDTTDDGTQNGFERLQALASQLSGEEIQLYYQIGQHARRDMPFATDQREAFDMALLRMVAFAPQPSNGEPVVLNSAQTKSDAPAAMPLSTPAQTAPATTTAPAPSNTAQKKNNLKPDAPKSAAGKRLSPGAQAALAALNAEPMPEADVQELLAATNTQPAQTTESVRDADPVIKSASAQKQTPAPVEKAVPVATIAISSLTAETWPDAVANMSLSGMPRQLASHSVLASNSGSDITLHLEDHAEHLNTAQFTARLQTALSEYTRTDINLSIEVVTDTLNTPAKIETQRNEASLEAARAAIDDDPLVKQLISEVDGVVDHDSVQPIN